MSKKNRIQKKLLFVVRTKSGYLPIDTPHGKDHVNKNVKSIFSKMDLTYDVDTRIVFPQEWDNEPYPEGLLEMNLNSLCRFSFHFFDNGKRKEYDDRTMGFGYEFFLNLKKERKNLENINFCMAKAMKEYIKKSKIIKCPKIKPDKTMKERDQDYNVTARFFKSFATVVFTAAFPDDKYCDGLMFVLVSLTFEKNITSEHSDIKNLFFASAITSAVMTAVLVAQQLRALSAGLNTAIFCATALLHMVFLFLPYLLRSSTLRNKVILLVPVALAVIGMGFLCFFDMQPNHSSRLLYFLWALLSFSTALAAFLSGAQHIKELSHWGLIEYAVMIFFPILILIGAVFNIIWIQWTIPVLLMAAMHLFFTEMRRFLKDDKEKYRWT